MIRIGERINRRTALVQLTAAIAFAAGPAKAQRPDPSLAQIKTTNLGHKTYMFEGQGGNILVVIGDDGIIMVDAEFAPLHDKIKAAIIENSKSSHKVSRRHPFPWRADRRQCPVPTGRRHHCGARQCAGPLASGHTTNGLNYNKSPPAHPDAIPAETYVGGTKTVAVRGREVLLTHGSISSGWPTTRSSGRDHDDC